jgi:hypothetical protein
MTDTPNAPEPEPQPEPEPEPEQTPEPDVEPSEPWAHGEQLEENESSDDAS